MNILLYVTALLTALSIMTYARLSNFINQAAIRKETACYMGEKDRIEANKAQRKYYTSQRTEKEGKDQTPKQQRTEATKKLNFIVFVNKQMRDQNDAAYKTITSITKQLLANLYQNEAFFKKVQESRGDAIEALFSRLIQVSEAAEEEKSVKDINGLLSLDLQDPELQEFFAKMLLGASTPEITGCPQPKRRGYPSLLSFINVEKKKKNGSIKPIRIQLAPREIIEAIFLDPNTIEEVLTMRKELQKQSGKMETVEKQVASQQFERVFRSRIPGYLDQKMFDFTITQTRVDNRYTR